MKKTLLAAAALLALPTLASCSWGRFNEVSDDPPVILLHRSEAFGGFLDARSVGEGAARQTILFGSTARTNHLVGWSLGAGDSPAAVGVSTPAGLDYKNFVPAAINSGSAAFLGIIGDTKACWVHGFRAFPNYAKDSNPNLVGLAVTCLPTDDSPNLEDTIDLFPEGFDPAVVADTVFPVTATNTGLTFPGVAAFSSWKEGHFVMGTPDRRSAYVYLSPTPGAFQTQKDVRWTVPPISLAEPDEQDSRASYGAAVATLPSSGTATVLGLVVSEPVSGKIFLYDVDTATRSPSRRACIQAAPMMGVVLHAFVDGGKRLVAASDGAGSVALYDFDAAPSGDCAPATPLGSFACSENADVTGCNLGAFGYSLGHGDLDGDGDQELLVGAPGLNVREKVNAGAVFLFDLEAVPTASDVLYLGQPKNQALLGASVSAARQGTRDVPLGGMPGSNDVAMFFCSAFSKSSTRCQ